MRLGSRFAPPVLSPIHAIGHQLNGRRIDQMNRSLEAKGVILAAVLMGKLARADEVVRRVQTFPDPHQQAVLLARLRIATEATDVQL